MIWWCSFDVELVSDIISHLWILTVNYIQMCFFHLWKFLFKETYCNIDRTIVFDSNIDRTCLMGITWWHSKDSWWWNIEPPMIMLFVQLMMTWMKWEMNEWERKAVLLSRWELAESNDDDDERLLRWKDDVDDLKWVSKWKTTHENMRHTYHHSVDCEVTLLLDCSYRDDDYRYLMNY